MCSRSDPTQTQRFQITALATALIAALLAFGIGCSGGSDNNPAAPPDPGGGGGLTNAVFGAIGCSQTRDAMEGYFRVGGQMSWDPRGMERYGGMEIDSWADLSHPLWGDFQALADEHGSDTVIVWFQICVRERTSPTPTAADLTDAEIVVDEILRRVPSAVVYASQINAYVDARECDSIGPQGVETSASIADHLVSRGMAQLGPVLGPLDNGNTISDNCHANTSGKRLQGNQLAGFFEPLL